MKKISIFIFLLVFHYAMVLPVLATHGGTHLTNPAPDFFVDFGQGRNTFHNLFLFIVQRLLPLAGIAAVLFIIIGGFQYMLSGANEEQAEHGKKTLRNAIIGLALVVLSYVIVVVIINALFRT